MQFGAWAFSLRQAEALAPLQDRDKTRHALAVIFGPSNGTAKTISRVVEVSPQEKKKAAVLAKEFLKNRKANGASDEVFLAALAEAGAILVSEMGKRRDPDGD